jgi:hemin uptake protein HemP
MSNGKRALERIRSATPGPDLPATQTSRPDRCPRVDSALLLCGGRELEIVHQDAIYRLRLTAMGKLILTK